MEGGEGLWRIMKNHYKKGDELICCEILITVNIIPEMNLFLDTPKWNARYYIVCINYSIPCVFSFTTIILNLITIILCIHFESAQVSPASEVQVILFKHFKIDSIIIIITIHECTHSKAEMKCPVCRTLQVDPCTLQCGHTICQLCLARMYKNFDKFCPMCKEPWSVFPAISYSYRYS